MFALKKVVVEDVFDMDDLQLTSNVISIEGQSGSGKSTLLRLLNNLDDPTSGTITYHGEEISSILPQELRRKVVMLSQNPVMFNGTLRDNLQIGRKFSGKDNVSDNELKEIMDVLWMEKELDTEASDLSGGEKERIALGRILLMDTAEVYLLDEPSSDLDDKTTEKVMRPFIEKATEDHKQIIMVTHDKEVSNQFADTLINMDQYSKQASIRGEEEA